MTTRSRLDPRTGQPLPTGVYPSGREHYQFRIQPRGTDPDTGARYAPIVRGGFLSAEDAAAARERVAAQLGMGQSREVVAGALTVAVYVDRYLTDHAERGVKPATIYRYRRLAARFILSDPIGAIPVQDLTAEQVEAWVWRSVRRATPGEARQARGLLVQVLNRAVVLLRLPLNVASLASVPPVTPTPRRALTSREAARLVAEIEARNDTLRGAWYLMLFAQLRPGEVLSLRWTEVDLETGRITIAATNTRDLAGRWVRGTSPKTPASRRTFVLPPVCVEALRTHRAWLNEKRLSAPPGTWEEQGLVFPSWGGRLRRHKEVAARLKRLCAWAGIDPPITPHELRHSGATIARIEGIEPEVLQRRLGHKRIGTTLGIYSHLGDDPDAQAAASDAMQAVWERLRRLAS